MSNQWFAVPPDERDRLIRQADYSNHLARKTSRNVISLNEAYTTHCGNHARLLDLEEQLVSLIDATPDKRSQREQTLRYVKQGFHNYLSSMYSLKGTVEGAFKELGLNRTEHYRLERYRDETALLHGLRTYVQHRRPLNILWMARQCDGDDGLTYDIGVWLSDLVTPNFYDARYDASGTKHDGVEYYFGEVDEAFLDLFDVARTNIDVTAEFYKECVTTICEEMTDEIDAFDDDIHDLLYEQATTLPPGLDHIGN